MFSEDPHYLATSKHKFIEHLVAKEEREHLKQETGIMDKAEEEAEAATAAKVEAKAITHAEEARLESAGKVAKEEECGNIKSDPPP